MPDEINNTNIAYLEDLKRESAKLRIQPVSMTETYDEIFRQFRRMVRFIPFDRSVPRLLFVTLDQDGNVQTNGNMSRDQIVAFCEAVLAGNLRMKDDA